MNAYNNNPNNRSSLPRQPIKKVAAIKYDANDDAPKVIAKGKGIIAENILERAEAENLPIYKDEKLADTLTKLDIGDYIPPELYKIIAEIMIFVSDLDKMKDKLHLQK
jgi:flagellar biosynthesis protein